MRDVVFDNGNLDAELMVKYTLPDLLCNQRYTPVFKYLRGAGYMERPTNDVASLDPKVRKAMQVTAATLLPSRTWVSDKRREEIARKVVGLTGLQKNYSTEQCAMYIPLLDRNAITLDEIKRFLQSNFDVLFSDDTGRVALKKLVALYDLRRAGPKDGRT